MEQKKPSGMPEIRSAGRRRKGWWGRYLERLTKSTPTGPARAGAGCKH